MCFLFTGYPRWAMVNSHWYAGFVTKDKFAGPCFSDFHLCLYDYDWPVSSHDNPICVVLFACERCVLCPSTIAQRSTSCPWASSLTVGWVWQTSCGRRTLREIKSCDWWWLLANQRVVLGTILFHRRVWPKPFLSIVGSSLSFNPKNRADEEICLWHPGFQRSCLGTIFFNLTWDHQSWALPRISG